MSLLNAPTYRWTVKEYEELGRAGFLNGDTRVELLNGEIIVMSPIGYRHAKAVTLLNNFLVQHARGRYLVSPQNPFVLDDYSEPQPDLTLIDSVCARLDRHPESAEIFLVIEVADSTVRYDREKKGPAYAAQGVREYWLLNLQRNCLEVFRNPQNGAFADESVHEPDATASPLAFPDLVLRVGDFLP